MNIISQSMFLRVITLCASFAMSLTFPLLFNFDLYGKFVFIMSIGKIATVLGGMGLSHYIIQNYSEHEELGKSFYQIIPYLFLGCLCSATALSFISSIEISILEIFCYALVLNLAYCVSALVRMSKSSFQASLIEAMIGHIFILLSMLFCYMIYRLEVSANLIVINYLILCSIAIIYLCTKSLLLGKPNVKSLFYGIAFQKLQACVVMALTFASIALLRNVDIIILKEYVTDEALGKFKIIAVIIYLPILFHGTIETLLIPRLRPGVRQLSFKEYRLLSRQSAFVNILLAIPILVATSLLIEPIYGVKFADVRQYLVVGVVSSAILSIFGFYTTMLNYNGFHLYFAIVMVMVNILNLVLNLVLIPAQHEFGAVISTAISILIIGTLSSLKVRQVWR